MFKLVNNLAHAMASATGPLELCTVEDTAVPLEESSRIVSYDAVQVLGIPSRTCINE